MSWLVLASKMASRNGHEHHQQGEEREEGVVGDLGGEAALAVDAGLVDGAPQDVEEAGAGSQPRDPRGQRPGHGRDPNERWSGPFEVPGQLPVGDAPVEGHPLLAGAVQQVEVDLLAEGLLGQGRGLPEVDGVDEVPRDPGQVVVVVAAAVERRRRLDLVADAVQPAGDRGREGQVRVGVAPGDAALDPGAAAVPDLPEAERPVVDPPADGGGRPRAGLEPLVAVDVGGEEDGELLRGGQQPPRYQRKSSLIPCSPWWSSMSEPPVAASHRLEWMWHDEPVSSKSYLAMNEMARPLSAAISLAAFL